MYHDVNSMGTTAPTTSLPPRPGPASMSDLDDYIAGLGQCEATTHIELDRDAEIAYMLEERFHFRQILRALTRRESPARILDVGTTPFTLFLAEAYPGSEVHTVDRTDLLQARCAVHGVGHHVCDLDNDALPFADEFFDVVIFTEVLEHVFAPPSRVLGEMFRILRPGGSLVISVPNIAALHKRIKLLFGLTPLPPPDIQMQKDWVHGHGHLHEYTRKELVGLLRGCGFTAERTKFMRPRVGDALATRHRRPAARVMRAAYHAIQALWPAFGTQIFVECRRPAGR